MPVKAKNENTVPFIAKRQERWEKQYPDKRCVMVPDPDKLQGVERNDALRQRARYYNLDGLQYRVLELTDEERIALMDTDACLLMACDKREYEAWKASQVNPTPNETEDILTDSGVISEDGRMF